MGCNCGGNKRSVRSSRGSTPTRSQIGGISQQPSATNATNIARSRNLRNPELNSSNPNVLSGDKQRIAKIRREAVRKALGR